MSKYVKNTVVQYCIAQYMIFKNYLEPLKAILVLNIQVYLDQFINYVNDTQ